MSNDYLNKLLDKVILEKGVPNASVPLFKLICRDADLLYKKLDPYLFENLKDNISEIYFSEIVMMTHLICFSLQISTRILGYETKGDLKHFDLLTKSLFPALIYFLKYTANSNEIKLKEIYQFEAVFVSSHEYFEECSKWYVDFNNDVFQDQDIHNHEDIYNKGLINKLYFELLNVIESKDPVQRKSILFSLLNNYDSELYETTLMNYLESSRIPTENKPSEIPVKISSKNDNMKFSNKITLSCPRCNRKYNADIPVKPLLYRCKQCKEIIVSYPIIPNNILENPIPPNENIDTKTFSKEYFDIRVNSIKFQLYELFNDSKINSAYLSKVGF
ncbi:MAG: hypothetical protein JXR49_22250 [Acidobacteria bacterium]|nr:hypothetical protein [Acidobacteriota bacterium]